MISLRPINNYLTKFDRMQSPLNDIPGDLVDMPNRDSRAEDCAQCERRAAEVQAAREQARAEVEREYDALLQQAGERMEARIDAERNRWSEEEGARLATQFQHAIECSVASLGETIGRLTAPFLTHAILQRSLSDFIDAVRAAFSDCQNPLIHLHGPEDLIEIVSRRLALDHIAVSATKADAIDVKATIDNTTIETQIAEWIGRLRNGER